MALMAKKTWNRNNEGYYDGTAGAALRNVTREERKENMKKRNCRRTADENMIHEKAVKMRKMTDEQLVHYVEDRVEKARSEGFNQGKEQAPKARPVNIEKLIEDIGNVRGIGLTKLDLIRMVLEKHLGREKMPDPRRRVGIPAHRTDGKSIIKTEGWKVISKKDMERVEVKDEDSENGARAEDQ